ncbi:hypothetical protein ESA94_02730 [Lacibacter luteus]|uniref:Uncharacterized protein n=1 Tax=Lacibacter luteus TaxID=2508719 RepID=A0A4Q1CMI8_9BACT|nr:hypothetical protein [Lacibacter luteus]RXK61945.1 hypothetical protein ESA94_02730 [Lacibacter luteus]
MPKLLLGILRAALLLILALKIINLFLHFPKEINALLNAAMFTLIGINFILVGSKWDKPIIKIIFSVCGLYLVVMNFFSSTALLNVIGIVCILTPIIIARFSTDKEKLAKAD